MAERRILLVKGAETSVANEARFESESKLQQAISRHPEVLPAEDLGLGPLISLANEVDLGHGPIDLLAADPLGRLVIVEFKRGTENPDIRKVVAQVLDYGSSLWQLSFADLESACRRCVPDFRGTLTEQAERAFAKNKGVVFDRDAFEAGVNACLESGDFVFLYVGRDMDARTRRIMTYLSEGPRMTFFAVEVDYFRSANDDHDTLVPRTAFVPSWITSQLKVRGRESGLSAAERLEKAPPGTQELMKLMDALATELKLEIADNPRGRVYRDSHRVGGVGIFTSSRGAEFDLNAIREIGNDVIADQLTKAMGELTGKPVTAKAYPSVQCAALVEDWERSRSMVIEPYFMALKQRIFDWEA